jgi:hypothetical protein
MQAPTTHHWVRVGMDIADIEFYMFKHYSGTCHSGIAQLKGCVPLLREW